MITDRTGHQLGNYYLIRLLGQDEFADVYLGEHIPSKKRVTIKVLQTQLTANDYKSFFTEALSLFHLKHPYIMSMSDFGVHDEIPFLVTDYAFLGTVRQLFPKGTRMPEENIVTYVNQIAAALQYAHNQGIIHGNLRPENMLLGAANEILLSDFGIPLVTRDSFSRITGERIDGDAVAYMAPEQLQGEACPASDEYALGIIVYEWLCGDLPFHGSATEVVTQHLSAPPPRLREKAEGISSYVEEVVMLALQKDPKQRFANIQAFATALEIASPLPTVLRPRGPVLPDQFIYPSDAAKMPPQIESPATFILPSAQTPPPPSSRQPRFSRRAVIVGLAGLVTLGTVITATTLGLTHRSQRSSSSTAENLSTPNSTPAPTLPPSAFPQGSTLYIYRGHQGNVFIVGWSPGSNRIASASHDKTVQVWGALSGHHVLFYLGHADFVYTLEWSPDGTRIASGSRDTTVQIWDAVTGNTLLTYTGHTLQVNTLVWSHDGKYIASGSNDHTVQVWDAMSLKLAFSYPLTRSPRTVAWSPNGKYLAFGGDDKLVHVLDATSRQLIYTYRGHTARVWGIAWSPDSTSIASGSDDLTVQVWDATTGNHSYIYTGHSHQVTMVAWSPDGTRIASGANLTIQVWDPRTPPGKLLFTYEHHTLPVSVARWAPNGLYVASGAQDATVQVWKGV